MLAVLAIVSIVVGLSVPKLIGMNKANGLSVAGCQLRDDLNLARQLAINNRSYVYVLFVYRAAFTNESFKGGEGRQYAIYSDRRVGDQPGTTHPTFLSKWKTLPENIYIIPYKFSFLEQNQKLDHTHFQRKNFSFPRELFPKEKSALEISFEYVEFSPTGQLVTNVAKQDEIITLYNGTSVRDLNPDGSIRNLYLLETTVGEYTNFPTRIRIDRLTGKSRLERPELNGERPDINL